MKIFVPKETHPNETRVSMLPPIAKKLVDLGAELEIEAGLGATLHIPDEEYISSGAKIVKREDGLKSADMILRLRKPEEGEISLLKEGCIHISYLEPFNSPSLLGKLASQKVTAFSMEMIPRTTLAQKMDSLSSQANLAGYIAVIIAAERLPRTFPMMTTPSGTISPARVFIVGAGVAGLQAIATAKRLGARVEAFDTRPVVEEQVKSLGAKFVKIDLGETGQTEQGYARALTEEQIKKQREGMAKVCAGSDVIITTAMIQGKKAPIIITQEMIKGMKPGSVIVDLAAETGGNVEGCKLDEEVNVNGVRIFGISNLPGRVPFDSSAMYTNNLFNMISHFWNKAEKKFQLKMNDEIIAGCTITHEGKIVHPLFQEKKEG